MIDLGYMDDESHFAGATAPMQSHRFSYRRTGRPEIAPETATPPGAQAGRGQIHRKESGSAADITPVGAISAPKGSGYPR
jgi:hypothetical protein